MDSSSFQPQQDVECVESPKQSGLNVSERRELIHALSNQPEEASELLNSWSRNEIMKIICAEMGKERKYTGLNKPKLIENLLNLVSRPLGETSCPTDRRNSRKKQKTTSYVVCCENLACRAALGSEDTFCRRCSCCICHKFDDNKDPSLWLTCEACGLSCHLECGLKQESYGIGNVGRGLDGRFYCPFCGKDSDLLGCWRKQVKAAKETRRVDVLCYRLSLGQKLLRGTRRYQNLLEFMDEAVKKLECDVGPLSGCGMKMGRGIVNRLSSGSQVQKLCSMAIKALDKMVLSSGSKQCNTIDESELRFSTLKDDRDEAGNRQSPLTNSSSGLCSNPSLLEDESNNARKSCFKENSDEDNIEHCSAGEVESAVEAERVLKRKLKKIGGKDLLVTPCKRDTFKGKQRCKPGNGKPEMNIGDKELGHIVKTIRRLEQEGHIEKSFRERFLTWYSLRASEREVRVVKLFVETFMEDMSSLGQQLADTFSECILSKRSSSSGAVPAGICLKLWH